MRISDWSSDVCSSDLSATGEHDALINAYGTIETAPVVIGVQDFAYMGGSMGMGVGAAFIQGIEEAIYRRCPYIIFRPEASRVGTECVRQCRSRWSPYPHKNKTIYL